VLLRQSGGRDAAAQDTRQHSSVGAAADNDPPGRCACPWLDPAGRKPADPGERWRRLTRPACDDLLGVVVDGDDWIDQVEVAARVHSQAFGQRQSPAASAGGKTRPDLRDKRGCGLHGPGKPLHAGWQRSFRPPADRPRHAAKHRNGTFPVQKTERPALAG
jgi:hypothetical protein